MRSRKFFANDFVENNHCEVSAIVTAYKRIEQTLATLRVIQSCTPAPDEILVHVDANQSRM